MEPMPTVSRLDRPIIFDYLDYRQFLNDYLIHLKIKGISARSLSKRMGYKSPNYLQLIIAGKRSIALSAALTTGYGLRLKKEEIQFLEQLIKLDRAPNVEEKDKVFRELLLMRGLKTKRELHISEYSFFRDWRMVALFEAIPTEWSRLSRSKLATALETDESGLDLALEHLIKLGLVEESKSLYRKQNRTVEAPVSMFNEDLRRFHRETVQKALRAIEEKPIEDRHVGALILSLSPEQFDLFKRRLEEFKRELNIMFPADANRKGVYQFQFQLYSVIDHLRDLFKTES